MTRTARRYHIALFALPLLCGIALVVGCSATIQAAAPAPTVTTTVTVTATPTAEAEASDVAEVAEDDPISAEDAWLLCFGATSGMYAGTHTVYPYGVTATYGEPTVTDNGDGSFTVLVAYVPVNPVGDGYGAESICIASGTVGDPVVTLSGSRHFD